MQFLRWEFQINLQLIVNCDWILGAFQALEIMRWSTLNIETNICSQWLWAREQNFNILTMDHFTIFNFTRNTVAACRASHELGAVLAFFGGWYICSYWAKNVWTSITNPDTRWCQKSLYKCHITIKPPLLELASSSLRPSSYIIWWCANQLYRTVSSILLDVHVQFGFVFQNLNMQNCFPHVMQCMHGSQLILYRFQKIPI